MVKVKQAGRQGGTNQSDLSCTIAGFFRLPVLGGGGRLETGRDSHQSITSRYNHPTRLGDNWRGAGNSPRRTSRCIVAGASETMSGKAANSRYKGAAAILPPPAHGMQPDQTSEGNKKNIRHGTTSPFKTIEWRFYHLAWITQTNVLT